MKSLSCRFCGTPLRHTFVDLGMSPLSNAYLSEGQLLDPEPFYPLKAFVCEDCFLVQLPEFEPPEKIFSEYAYFSSVSDSWLDHCERYADTMLKRLSLGPQSRVVEVASNDGYLLQYFRNAGVSVLGVEPAGNVAEVATAAGIPTVVRFFGTRTADDLVADGYQADLLIGNNVLAHVPDVNDFVEGLRRMLKPTGVVTLEFPHLARLMEQRQFDTIYHEHFSYLSFTVVARILATHGLTVFDVEELSTHGGSLRVFAAPTEANREVQPAATDLLAREAAGGFARLEHYLGFDAQVAAVKRDLLSFLIEARREGLAVVGYGAAAKGNTLLNYCGIRSDLLDYVADKSLHKQGKYLPGTHLPIVPPERLRDTRPAYVLILPWNLRAEIIEQLAFIREWGGRFVVPIPNVEVLP
jgi:2-polyprenyl-3-methyl-5-hydroxy-6-metoxy-1,4-benzoquinol methylase